MNHLDSAKHPLSHATAKVNGVRLHYARGGKGPVLLLLHGWPQTWWEWRHVIPLLVDRFSIVAVDLRGFGDSERPPPEAGYDVATVCADLVGLMDHLDMKRGFVAGHDLGGLVAYALARLHPSRIDAVALLDAPLPLYGLEVPFWAEIEKQLWHQRFHRVPYLPEALVAGKERLYLSWHFSSAFDPTAIGPQDIDEYVRCYSKPGGLAASFAFSRAAEKSAEQVKSAAREKMKIPLLFLGGELTLQDKFGPFLNQIAENAQAMTVPGSGHWMPEENPAFVAERLRSFLQ